MAKQRKAQLSNGKEKIKPQKGGHAMRGPNKPFTAFGKLVVKALTDQDMTRAQLAAAVGISPQYLSQILNGVRPGGKDIPAIAALLGLDPAEVQEAIAA